MRRLKSARTPAQLEREIDEALASAREKRIARDLLERPSPQRVLHRIDHALQTAEDQIGRHLATTESAQESPKAHKIGSEIFDDIERIRWKIRKWRS